MERRGLSLRLYFFAFVISLLVFVVGVVLGWQWGYSAVTQMGAELDSLNSQNAEMDLVSLMENQSFACPVYESEFSRLFQAAQDYGDKLAEMERRKGKLDPEVMRLKEDYAAMQLRNYLLQQKMDSKCGSRHNVILYFYSNENYSQAADEGIQIGEVARGFGVYTYHFDVNAAGPVVAGLKAGYGVRATPTLIINGEKFEGFMDAAALAQALRGNGS
ncbi:MAG: hypothetical protein PHF51_02310 [Candidatus ainarchaeum sp.]|nr:hypothetical protein [Candidatus ainarchaeum sp.]